MASWTRNTTRWAGLAILTFASFGVMSSSAQADESHVIELPRIIIEGDQQKPGAFYILNRTALGYELQDLRQSFVRELPSSVNDGPF